MFGTSKGQHKKGANTHVPIKHPKEMTKDELWENYGKWVQRLAWYFKNAYPHATLQTLELWGIGWQALQKSAEYWDPNGAAGFMHFSKLNIMAFMRREVLNYHLLYRGKTYQQDKKDVSPRMYRGTSYTEGAHAPQADDVIMHVRSRVMFNSGLTQNIYDSSRRDHDRSEYTMAPDELVNQVRHVEQVLARMFKRLDAREIKILEYRYGLGGKPQLTFDQIASKMNISRQRVSQMEIKALHKLRKSFGQKSELPAYLSSGYQRKSAARRCAAEKREAAA